MALSSSRRPSPASPPKPVEPTPAPPASAPAGSGLSDADEISKLLSALGGDTDIILPPNESPIVKLAPAAGTVKLSPGSLVQRSGIGVARLGDAQTDLSNLAKPGTVRLGGDSADSAKTVGHGTVHLTGNQTDAAKTAKHGTVRLTGNQTEAAKTAKHGTVRLTGNQTEAAKTAVAVAVSAPPAATPTAQVAAPVASPVAAPVAVPTAAKEDKPAPKGGRIRRKKPSKPKRSNGGQDPLASVVFMILVILVVLLYVGFFIVRPKIIAARSAAQPVPAQTATEKPGARKPAARPKPTVKAKPSGKTSPSAVKPQPVADKPAEDEERSGLPAPQSGASVKNHHGSVASTGAITDNGLGEVDVPEDDDPAEGASTAAIPLTVEEPRPTSKFAPPWARKDTAQPVEEKPREVVIEVPAAVDVPEVREWPELRVTAVIGSGKKGSVLVNGTVVSVGEELEEGPILKSVTRQAAIFEWDGDRRTIYVSSKSE